MKDNTYYTNFIMEIMSVQNKRGLPTLEEETIKGIEKATEDLTELEKQILFLRFQSQMTFEEINTFCNIKNSRRTHNKIINDIENSSKIYYILNGETEGSRIIESAKALIEKQRHRSMQEDYSEEIKKLEVRHLDAFGISIDGIRFLRENQLFDIEDAIDGKAMPKVKDQKEFNRIVMELGL